MPKESPFLNIGGCGPVSITLRLSKVFEKIVAGKLNIFLESNSLLHLSQSSYRRDLRICDALLILSRHLQIALDRGIERRFVQLDFPIAFDRVSYRSLLYKLRRVGIGGMFLFMVSGFFSDRWQRVRLDGKISASVDDVSGVNQGGVLGSLLFISYPSEFF